VANVLKSFTTESVKELADGEKACFSNLWSLYMSASALALFGWQFLLFFSPSVSQNQKIILVGRNLKV